MKRYTMAATLAVLSACGGKEPRHATVPPEPPSIAVSTVAAAMTDTPELYSATGTVRPRMSGVVASRIIAYVKEVRAQVGTRVNVGQPLIILDSRDLDTAHSQAQAAEREAKLALAELDNSAAAAKAQLDLAEATFRRMQDLHSKNSVSNQEFDEATARRNTAQAAFDAIRPRRGQTEEKIRQAAEAVKSAEISRGFATIEAPFAGVVTERKVEPGNLAAPGTPLLVIEQDGAYRLEADIEESRFSTIKAGVPVKVTLDAIERVITSNVSEIVPSVDSASRSFTARINLPGNLPLRNGMFGRAEFALGSRQALTAPAHSISKSGQVESVFVVEDGRARRRLVTVGTSTAGRVEILSGLAAGELVISPIPPALADGSRVEVRP